MNRIRKGSFLAGIIWTAALTRAADAVPLSVRIYKYAQVPEPILAYRSSSEVSQFSSSRLLKSAS
jgi:hypothetical protein